MGTQKIRSFRKLLRRFQRLTADRLREDSCCQGVTLAQCHTILEIEELGQAAAVELSKRLGLDKSTLSRTIDGMVNSGLVDRIPHPTDRRFTLLTLTALGQEAADRINQSNDDYYTQVFKQIETESHDTVINSFEKLVLAIRSHQSRVEKEKGCVPGFAKGE
jgi:DNA-binding MarR family transcriptional regulator